MENLNYRSKEMIAFPQKNYNNNNIYWDLINDFNKHFLNDKRKTLLVDYIRNNYDNCISNDLIMIIEDYNCVISQSIQAIKSLLLENERLLEEQMLNIINKNERIEKNNVKDNENVNQEKKEEKLEKESLNIIQTNINNKNKGSLKKPLRRQINSRSNSKEKRNNKSLEKNKNDNLNFLNLNKQLKNKIYIEDNSLRNNKTNSKNKIEIMKITNEILKLIDIANEIKTYLVEKYINSSSSNYEIDYKEFLNRLINYNFDLYTLNEILTDLQNNNNKNINYQSMISKNDDIKNNPFSYSLLNRPPFINATNPYGQLFSKKKTKK